MPIFVAKIDDRQYEQEVINLCQEDTACIFDIVATGSTDVGLSTLQQTIVISNVTKISQPSKSSKIPMYFILQFQLYVNHLV